MIFLFFPVKDENFPLPVLWKDMIENGNQLRVYVHALETHLSCSEVLGRPAAHSCATEAQEILEKVLQGRGTQPSLLRWHLASAQSGSCENCCGVLWGTLFASTTPKVRTLLIKKGKACHHLRSRCRPSSSAADLPAPGRGSGGGRGHSSGVCS